jgi:hypothetical protein
VIHLAASAHNPPAVERRDLRRLAPDDPVEAIGLAVGGRQHLLLQEIEHPACRQPEITSGARFDRLMPQARITTSSLFFVMRPIVTSVATRAAIGMT